jgi:rhodanese-related sulfurtransferase
LSGHFEVEGATKIDVPTAKALHDRAVTFVDVSAFRVELIPRAHRLHYTNELDEIPLLDLVDKTQEVVFYGLPEVAPAYASAKAIYWGFERVYYFPDGTDGWRRAGHPVE